MSAFGPKQTWAVAPHMSAFGGKADMALCGNSLLRSLLGAKQTWLIALHMSAFDPKRTSATAFKPLVEPSIILSLEALGRDETARIYQWSQYRCGYMAFRGTGTV
jgi:hypothetical protein